MSLGKRRLPALPSLVEQGLGLALGDPAIGTQEPLHRVVLGDLAGSVEPTYPVDHLVSLHDVSSRSDSARVRRNPQVSVTS